MFILIRCSILNWYTECVKRFCCLFDDELSRFQEFYTKWLMSCCERFLRQIRFVKLKLWVRILDEGWLVCIPYVSFAVSEEFSQLWSWELLKVSNCLKFLELFLWRKWFFVSNFNGDTQFYQALPITAPYIGPSFWADPCIYWTWEISSFSIIGHRVNCLAKPIAGKSLKAHALIHDKVCHRATRMAIWPCIVVH